MQEHEGGAGGAGAAVGSDRAGGSEEGLEPGRLEPFIQQIGAAHRHHLDQQRLVRAAQPPEPAPELQDLERSIEPGRRRIGRSHRQHRPDAIGHPEDRGVEPRVRLRVSCREASDLPRVLALSEAEQQGSAVRKWSERRSAGEELEASLQQTEIPDDLGTQQRADVRRGREEMARQELLGDARAPDDLPALDDDRPEAGRGKIGRGDQTVVPGPQDEDVDLLPHARPPDPVSLSAVARGPNPGGSSPGSP